MSTHEPSSDLSSRLRAKIRTVSDFPKPGIQFRDITTLLLEPALMNEGLDALWHTVSGKRVDLIAGIESRGFILGAAMAWQRDRPFVPLRKPGKLPAETYAEAYDLEYGKDELHVHIDAVPREASVFIVDDLLATGGTARAAARLVERAGATVAGIGFFVELPDLKGRARLEGWEVHSLVSFEGD